MASAGGNSWRRGMAKKRSGSGENTAKLAKNVNIGVAKAAGGGEHRNIVESGVWRSAAYLHGGGESENRREESGGVSAAIEISEKRQHRKPRRGSW